MSEDPFHKLTTFLKQLEEAHIHYTLASHREDAIMVLVTVPGERWEVEFLGDGSIEVERFLGNGEICGEEALRELWTRYADPEHAETR
ncbi:MAG: hypothetical protein ACREOH_06625 [Candidatus Entotheonellia bacterium]